jgi:hypothetical protein
MGVEFVDLERKTVVFKAIFPASSMKDYSIKEHEKSTEIETMEMEEVINIPPHHS